MDSRNEDTLGLQAIALIRDHNNKGLFELLSSKPVEVRDKYDTDNGRCERLDEFAERIGNNKAVRILRDAGAPLEPSNGRRHNLTKKPSPRR